MEFRAWIRDASRRLLADGELRVAAQIYRRERDEWNMERKIVLNLNRDGAVGLVVGGPRGRNR